MDGATPPEIRRKICVENHIKKITSPPWYNQPMQKILTAPNPMLREISKPVTTIDKKNLAVIKQVAEILKQRKPRGVGLSAIQIGKPLRVFCTFLPPSGDPDDKQEPVLRTFINPEILKASKEKILGAKTASPNQALTSQHQKPILEGCLCIPKVWGPVWRHTWTKVKYLTLNPIPYTLSERNERLSGFSARVFQHELDHLNGILFTDHSLKDKLPLYETKGDELVRIFM